jgi:hypothetical protein
MTDLNPAADLRAAADRLTLPGARILIAPRLTQPLAFLLTEVADCVEQEGGLVQDSTTEAAVDLAHAILDEQAPAAEAELDVDLPVQLDDALWDAIDIPGPAQPSPDAQHQRIRRVFSEHLQMLATAEDIDPDTGQPDAPAEPAVPTPDAELREQYTAALRSLTVISGTPPTILVPVMGGSLPMTRIVDWQPLDTLIHDLLAVRDTAMEQLRAERDGAYRERAHLVALLAAMTDGAVIAPAPDVDEPGWQIAYLTLGGWQCSWHIAPADAKLFARVEHVPADDPRAQWDGHTTDVKYRRIRTHTTVIAVRAAEDAQTIGADPRALDETPTTEAATPTPPDGLPVQLDDAIWDAIAMEQLRAERDMLGRETDRLRRDWVSMRARAENAETRLQLARDEPDVPADEGAQHPRLQLARDELAKDAYFDWDEIGLDLAPRLIEWLAHHNERVEQAEAALARVRALADDMRNWCSWRGMALHYSDAIREALNDPTTED